MTHSIGLAVLLSALLSAWPAVAAAQSCGADGDGGSDAGSSGGGSSGGSISSGDGSVDEGSVEVCRDHTDITGLEKCTRFGEGWDVSSWPALTFGLSTSLRRLTLGDVTLGGTSTHDENPYRYRLRGSDLASDGDGLFAVGLRGTGFLSRHLYTGLELAFGVRPLDGPALTDGLIELSPSSASLFTGGAIGGVAIPVGPLALRGEVAIGVRTLSIHFESRRGRCVTTTSATTSGVWIEPRLALDWFFTPWLALGAFGGADLLDGAAWHGGLTVSVHTRSYDGL